MAVKHSFIAALSIAFAGSAHGASLMPDPVLPSELTVRISEVAQVLPPSNSNNLASPVSVGDDLYVVDQRGEILRRNGAVFETILTSADVPTGITLDSNNSFLSMAEGRTQNEVFVVFTSKTLPTGAFPVSRLPDPLPGLCCTPPFLVDDLYRIGGPDSTSYQMIYKYERIGGDLLDPVPVAALEVQSGNLTHIGGGILTLPNGKILYATGDNLSAGTDGRAAAQDPSEHVSKLLLIDPDTGASEVAAVGVRNVQRIQFNDPDTKDAVSFADIGGVVAEEINSIEVATLLDTSEVENFGWGRNPDGNAREGTFYVAPGRALAFGEPVVLANAPSPEAGFIQPLAQYGRSNPLNFVAATGPVTSTLSFDKITSLFSDLPSGDVFATTSALNGTNVPVFAVQLVDDFGQPTSLLDLSGFVRADPRLFRFPDGSAGVLLERGGAIYSLAEVAAIPLPFAALLFGSSLVLLLGFGRRVRMN